MFMLMNGNNRHKGVKCRKGTLVLKSDVVDCPDKWWEDSRAEDVSEEEGKRMIAGGVVLTVFPATDNREIEIPVEDDVVAEDPYLSILDNNVDGVADLIADAEDIEFLGGLRDAEAEGRNRKGALEAIDDRMSDLSGD